ncbi:MAG: hypothetical protein K6G06_09480 [Butyrivibrio sp.]|nr:hypothetical protein [Butyrivibrio sp.]
MTAKKWFFTSLILTVLSLLLIGGVVFFVDPFFHYRAPNEKFFYKLYDERSQNDGITRNFDYDAIITGTSMAENFNATQFDRGMDVTTIKVPYSGATYKEIDDNLERAFDSGHNIKYVLRPLDYSLLVRDKDELRLDMGEYPVWLTNDNVLDDVKYLLNKDVISRYALPALAGFFMGRDGGHTSFDEYCYTGTNAKYGKEYVLMGQGKYKRPKKVHEPAKEELEMLAGNIEQNVVSLARQHPETTFIYFFPPYSMAYFGDLMEEADLDKMLYYKAYAIDKMLECDNIHIYSFTMHTDITADISRYRDQAHYDPNVNMTIMDLIMDGEKSGVSEDRITSENIDSYLEAEKELLKNFDYNSLLD